MTSLRLIDVTHRWGSGPPVVRNVSFDLAEGEVLTVLGPSGCGKSTLLRLIAGLDEPESGSIEIAGLRVNGVPPARRDIAMVFQSYALYPHLSVFDNVAVALKLRGMPKDAIHERVERAARRLGIEALLARRPRELSGGERQRVALARTLVREPRLFLLDEPLSNLDALLRERARGELKALFRELRATVVYVTHDQVEAMSMSDRVAVLRAGAVEQLGTPAEIYATPATTFVASFVGSPSMSFVPGAALGLPAHTAGVRPEDLRVGEGPGAWEVALREPLGGQHLLTLRRGALELRALVPAAWSGPASVSVAASTVHAFTAQGVRATLP